RATLHAASEEIARHAAAAHGCTAVVDIHVSGPVLRNDPELARAATPWLGRAGLEVDDTFRSFGSDDFAHFCAARPGLMLFLGVDGGVPDAAGKRPGLHSPRFLPGEDSVRQAALAFLGGHLEAARADVLAFTAFPKEVWRQISELQPQRAAQPGDPPAHRRRGHLPRPRRADPTGRRRPGRAARRMDRRPPLSRPRRPRP